MAFVSLSSCLRPLTSRGAAGTGAFVAGAALLGAASAVVAPVAGCAGCGGAGGRLAGVDVPRVAGDGAGTGCAGVGVAPAPACGATPGATGAGSGCVGAVCSMAGGSPTIGEPPAIEQTAPT